MTKSWPRKLWRDQKCNQEPYIKEEQKIQRPKRTVQRKLEQHEPH